MNLYYKINNPELIEKYGTKYFVEYDAKVSMVINESTFQPVARTRKMHPFKFCLERIWAEWSNKIEYIKWDHNEHVPNGEYPNTLPAVDLKEFLVVKLSAKELT
jgi:hypothetical protein